MSINREANGDVTFTVREAPVERDSVHICAHSRDAGPGRCVAGGPTCNNYCNMAPAKGPMQDSPLPCIQVIEGKTASFTVPAEAVAALFLNRVD
ncbi:hypothetical protein NT2_01_04620 [Caenibius tardaugens NBRC 16725]|uniref:Uncharacterized protein n=1 Tax=Caenibius tardaugens NBRC 16725 TaxID=1219035 RepID=U2ZQN1_9SPHN|nr:hypothetical protein NT2_01_04620 [Caenibius tardaugens NBRC 16725]